MIDLSQYSDAELASLAIQARQHLLAARAEKVKKNSKKAKAKRAKKERKDKALKDAERQAAKGLLLPGFIKFGIEVPDLDLREANLNELAGAKARSPYNKLLYRTGGALLNKEVTTLAELADVHRRLALGTTIEEPVALFAEITPEASAKVAAFAKVTGTTETQAHERLAALGMI